MPEPTDRLERLERLDAGPARPSLDAAGVRRLGERRRRRTTAGVAAGALVAVAAVVTPTVVLLGRDDTDGVVEPAGPAPTGLLGRLSGDDESDPTTIPADFPIDAGLLGPGDADVDGPVGAVRPWATPANLCDSEAWPISGEDALSYSEGGGEYFRGRVLVTYADEQTAVAVMEEVRAAVDRCPRSSDEAGNGYVNEELPPTTDDDSLTFTSVLDGGGLYGSVYQFVRVGSAVLATSSSAEYSAETARDGATVLTSDNREVVAAMCVFTTSGCG